MVETGYFTQTLIYYLRVWHWWSPTFRRGRIVELHRRVIEDLLPRVQRDRFCIPLIPLIPSMIVTGGNGPKRSTGDPAGLRMRPTITLMYSERRDQFQFEVHMYFVASLHRHSIGFFFFCSAALPEPEPHVCIVSLWMIEYSPKMSTEGVCTNFFRNVCRRCS